jgi:hypothetical protein
MRGEILDLNEPVPIPIMISPMIKADKELWGWTMTGGIADMTKMIWPTIAIAKA